MTFWPWSGIVLVAAGLVLFGFSRWSRSHISVQNGLVFAGCLSCLFNGIALLIVAIV
jgi:hypothetical protein